MEDRVTSKILIIGDDAQTQKDLMQAFADQAFRAYVTPKGRSVSFQLNLVRPDLIVLDTPYSKSDRWRVLRQIREMSFVPVIALISPDQVEIKVEGLESGADFSMAKPVSANELQARARALLRRARYVAQTAA
jgi:DNA-binding response OmpR family regulator